MNVRYPRELRDNLESLAQVLVRTPAGAQIPLGQIATLKTVQGPSMVRNESGLLAGYVYVDLDTSDVGGYVERAKEVVAKELRLPAGYSLGWSGQYENMLRVRRRLRVVVPVAIVLIVFLLYANTGSVVKTAIVMLAVPFSVIGAVWLLWALDYNVSIATWVGMIALMGLDAETGVFMLLFLDLSWDEARREGRLRTRADLVEAIVHGAVKRVRPKMMTVTAAFLVDRHGLRRHEADRGADGGRPVHVVPARAARIPGDLPALAGAGARADDRALIRHLLRHSGSRFRNRV